MTENEYRELFMALRLHPRWARKMLQFARSQSDHESYPQAVAAVHDQGATYGQLGDDFGVSRSRAREIAKSALRQLRRELGILPAEGHGLSREELHERSVDALGLDVRPANALRKGNVRTIGELVSLTEYDLLRMQGVGRISLRNIKERLALHELSLRRWTWDDPPPMD